MAVLLSLVLVAAADAKSRHVDPETNELPLRRYHLSTAVDAGDPISTNHRQPLVDQHRSYRRFQDVRLLLIVP